MLSFVISQCTVGEGEAPAPRIVRYTVTANSDLAVSHDETGFSWSGTSGTTSTAEGAAGAKCVAGAWTRANTCILRARLAEKPEVTVLWNEAGLLRESCHPFFRQ